MWLLVLSTIQGVCASIVNNYARLSFLYLYQRPVKLNFFAEFRSVPFQLALPRNSECLGMGTFIRGITETVPSLFRGIFSERNSVPNPIPEAMFGTAILSKVRDFRNSFCVFLLPDPVGCGTAIGNWTQISLAITSQRSLLSKTCRSFLCCRSLTDRFTPPLCPIFLRRALAYKVLLEACVGMLLCEIVNVVKQSCLAPILNCCLFRAVYFQPSLKNMCEIF